MNPNEDRERLLERAMARHHHSADALIEVLHVAQGLYGYLSPPLLRLIAKRLRLPESRVLGVATFYHLFRFEPPAKHTATVCLGTACYAAGGRQLYGELEKRCGAAADGWRVEAGRCLGSCGLAPIVIRDGEAISRVGREQLESLVQEAEKQ